MKKQKGQIILEVLISIALFSLVALSIAVIARDIVDVAIREMRKIESFYLAREGIEAIRAIGRADFEKLKNGIVGVEEINGQWEITRGVQKIRDFFRKITIENSPFEETKKIKVEVSFKDKNFKPENSVTLSGYLANKKIFALELNSSSYLKGDPIPWQASSWTIVFFVKPKTLSQIEGASLFANQDTSQNPQETGFLQIEFDGNADYQVKINDNTFRFGNIQDKWTFLAIVWDGGNFKTYIDGKNTLS